MDQYKEPMLEMYIFETSQLLEQLEQAIINNEKEGSITEDAINEIFRYMHTIKGSSSMMLFNEIASLAHSMEDLFYYLREQKPERVDFSRLSDLVLESIDFTKIEIEKIKNGDVVDGKAQNLILRNKEFLKELKGANAVSKTEEPVKTQEKAPQQYYIPSNPKTDSQSQSTYKAKVFFKEGCEMENIRAYTIIHNLTEWADDIRYQPEDITENDQTSAIIREKGFEIYFRTTKTYEEVEQFLLQTIFLKDMELQLVEDDTTYQEMLRPKVLEVVQNEVKIPQIEQQQDTGTRGEVKAATGGAGHTMISVHIEKMDKLMDLVGEMVIAEAMVTQHPEVEKLEIESFQKAARQLHKITNEIQDMVMAIRMVPLSTTFVKMHRIMRDMCKKLNKEVELKLIGEETEVDKNIIEHIGDPLMHLIRNALDHGIENNDDRVKIGKERVGTVVLEAKNAGSDVLIIIKDDGKGLNKEKILKKAMENGVLPKAPEELTDKEIYNLIFLPGFSTKEQVTEFSGRGVGMDVVSKNIEAVGGTIQVDSVENVGTTITLKIPLTLAIIDGMNIRVGKARYTIPILSIKGSFRPEINEVFRDPDGNEMIMIRGECLQILRLHEIYAVESAVTEMEQGILITVETGRKPLCLFADELIGEQQVVVKALPKYLNKKKNSGLSGCTLLGDGSISLILNIDALSTL